MQVNEFSDYKIAFEDEVRNCEDMVMDEKRGAIILSCDAGRDKWNTVMVSSISNILFAKLIIAISGHIHRSD
jgi:hypothetical protein